MVAPLQPPVPSRRSNVPAACQASRAAIGQAFAFWLIKPRLISERNASALITLVPATPTSCSMLDMSGKVSISTGPTEADAATRKQHKPETLVPAKFRAFPVRSFAHLWCMTLRPKVFTLRGVICNDIQLMLQNTQASGNDLILQDAATEVISLLPRALMYNEYLGMSIRSPGLATITTVP